jgi:integrase
MTNAPKTSRPRGTGSVSPKRRVVLKDGRRIVTDEPSGRWQARAYLADGRWWKATFGSEREAKAALARVLGAKADGQRTVPSAQRLGDWWEEWISTYLASKSARSQRDVRALGRRYLPRWLMARSLAKLTPTDVQRVLNGMAERGLSPTTIRMVRGALRAALNRALKLGKVTRNVAALTDAPPLQRRAYRWLTTEEAACFLTEAEAQDAARTAANPHGLHDDVGTALWTLLLMEGMRPGEALALQWGDWDEGAGTLQVRRALERFSGRARQVGDGQGWAFKDTKTGRHHTLVLTAASTRALRAHRARQRRLRLAMGPGYTDRGLIFASLTGGPCNTDVVAQRFKQVVAGLALRLTGQPPLPPLTLAGHTQRQHREAKAARAKLIATALATTGLDRLRLYDLRHSSATLGLEAGEGLKAVSERLGHSTITLTANVYSHVGDGTKRKAAVAREALLFGTSR